MGQSITSFLRVTAQSFLRVTAQSFLRVTAQSFLRVTAQSFLPAQPKPHQNRGDRGKEADDIGNDDGEVSERHAIRRPQHRPEGDDREVPDRDVTAGLFGEHPADL